MCKFNYLLLKTYFPFLILIFLLACKSQQSSVNSLEGMQEETGVIDLLHNSKNSLDWMGTYSGILPCADCMGIQTTLTLNENYTFEKSFIYLGKSTKVQYQKGSFTWLEEGGSISIIDLNDVSKTYKVEENQLRLLDLKGNKIEGNLEEDYLLVKSQSPIVNKYWKPVEIMGQKVNESENIKSEPHLILRSGGKFSGTGGCNSMFGGFSIIRKNGITFSNIAMTERECSYEHFDDNLVEALTMSRQFIMVDAEHMQLIVGKRAPLAKFEAIYLK